MEPGSSLPGTSAPDLCNYSDALDHFATIANMSHLDDTTPGLFIETEFQLNLQTFPIVAFVDSGNTYFNCISERACLAMGVKPSQLEPPPTKKVRQAGGGAMLEVLGILAGTAVDGFKFKNLPKLFPFKNMCVLRGLDHDFNLSLRFLMENKMQIDLEAYSLQYKQGLQTYKIPFLPRLVEEISIQELRPNVPKQGLPVPPGGTVTVQNATTLLDGVFVPRHSRFSSNWARSKTQLSDPDENYQPWKISRHPEDPTLFQIQNLSPDPMFVLSNMNIGSISAISGPPLDSLEITVKDAEQKLNIIREKVSVEDQFKDTFLNKLHDLLLSYADCISFNGEPGLTTLGMTYIYTPNITRGVYCPPNRISPDVYAIIEKQIKKWIEEGVIIPVDGRGSDWNARLIVVPKKRLPGAEPDWRVCIDLRHVNKLCMIDYSPFAPFSMQETFHMLANSVIFSCIDLTQAFNSIPIYEKHRYKTAFCINGQTYYFCKTPFGLSSAPASLGKVLATAFKNVPRSVAVYYMDDIIIFSDDVHKHLRHIRLVLKALLDAGLKICLKKCKFFRTKLEFLGHLITTEGYELIHGYLDAILNWPMIQSKYDVQSFLGSTNYYNEFIKNYATKAKPLLNVLKRPGKDDDIQEFTPLEAKAIWGAMEILKRDLTRAPTLAFADFSPTASNFILDTDYSAKHHTIGAVLSQIQPPGSGRERVIAYKAKSLRPTQKAYGSYKGEIFACCYFILKLRFFLQLRHFILRVDANSLKWLTTQSQLPTGIVLRWLQILSNNSFTVIHRKREEHHNADAMSRRPNASPISTTDDERALSALAPSTDTVLDCPFCPAKPSTEVDLDFHVDTQHFSLDRMSFKDWMTLQKMKGNNLQAAWASDPVSLAMASTPVKLSNYAYKSDPQEPLASFQEDGTITYSNKQWRAFQRLDPSLRLAIDTLEGVLLTEPISKAAHALAADGKMENGLLKYIFYGNNETEPRKLTVVPFALQIPIMMYFHQKYGCSDQLKTIERARHFVYFKNMPLAFKAMQQRCQACCRRNKANPSNNFQLVSHTYVEPWFAIAIDHVGPIDPPQNGHRYLFTVKDLFSGWTEFFPCPTIDSHHVVETLALEIMARYGVPNIIVADNHTAFTSKHFEKFCKDLGVQLTHSAARNPTGNWVERSHQDFKKKTNSLLRQQEEYSQSKYACTMCEQDFPSAFQLGLHLDKHDLSVISEATRSPAKEAEIRIQREMAHQSQKNWVATLPTVLWAMRTEYSTTRGASPYEILFGKKPTTSLDLLYGAPVQRQFFPSAADFLRAKHRRVELCEAFVKKNLAKELIRQRQYYVGKNRSFEKGDWVYLFTPVKTPNVSEKIDSYWSGPWSIDNRLASTTYRVVPIEGKFAGSFKPQTVQVDRIKTYTPGDPVVSPPRSFTGQLSDADLNVEQSVLRCKNDATKAAKASATAASALIQDDKYIEDATPPWQPPFHDDVPMPDSNGIWPENEVIPPHQFPEQWVKKRKLAKRFQGLPAPMLTRNRKEAGGQAINALSETTSKSVEERLELEFPLGQASNPEPLNNKKDQVAAQAHSDVQFWDRFMLFRYPGEGLTFSKITYTYSVPFLHSF